MPEPLSGYLAYAQLKSIRRRGNVAKANAVFSGGGIGGIVFVGAVQEAEEHGYEWPSLAGTSADGDLPMANPSAVVKSCQAGRVATHSRPSDSAGPGPLPQFELSLPAS